METFDFLSHSYVLESVVTQASLLRDRAAVVVHIICYIVYYTKPKGNERVVYILPRTAPKRPDLSSVGKHGLLIGNCQPRAEVSTAG